MILEKLSSKFGLVFFSFGNFLSLGNKSISKKLGESYHILTIIFNLLPKPSKNPIIPNVFIRL